MEDVVRLAGIGTGLLLGLASVLLRVGLQFESPQRAAWFITGVGAVVLLPASLKALPGFMHQHRWLFGVLTYLGSGIVGQTLGRLALYTCIDRLGPATAGTYKTVSPVFTAIVAWLVFGERLGVADALGIAAVIGGMLILVSFHSERSWGSWDWCNQSIPPRIHRQAFRLGLTTALLYSGGDILRRWGVEFLPSALIGTWLGYVAAFMSFTGYLFVRGGRRSFHRWDKRSILAFTHAAMAIMVAYILFLVGTMTAGVAITATLASIEPLAAFAVGIIFYRQGEPLTVVQVPGILLVVIGVAVILLA